jgi:peptide methionine sulfoxide reductase MsrA
MLDEIQSVLLAGGCWWRLRDVSSLTYASTKLLRIVADDA